MSPQPTPEEIAAYLAEDLGSGDITAAIIPESTQATARVVTRETMVLCGQAWFDAVFRQLSQDIMIEWFCREGDEVAANTMLCRLVGPARALLSGERTALNLLQTLSATSTTARRYANAIAGTGCKVLDTRKTLPGLRLAQKYAVTCGGCVNHRIGLFDAVLIKENHILAAGSICAAVNKARAISSVLVEVEVESLVELEEALAVEPDRIMLDNFSLADMRSAVALNQGKVELEASGNISLDNIRDIAETGVDYISIGALTKNVVAIDLSMRIEISTAQ
ncbi:carboxylating nicotinate-nucleotide diphosphorylase [Methylomonas sp. LL1]|uniref:carboxylating nicotinate-nucleotide diphosphorylase n=1 Tax=Methylomonas sp. LL1 TaxID=2785785 RepID=UPI0018C3F5A2|nr:carboxylating nicotinate-nucleotide diphosphorylase [Methylomonas sp. LL1]QPK62634.1 carboxylating nicotinate-nucleotide diphosphorylase [Methylomonas sp. LL1]